MRVLYAWDGKGNEPWSDILPAVSKLKARWFVPGKKVWEGELTEEGKLPVQEEELERLGVGRKEELEEGWDVYVCSHGARDCRCGDVGGELVEELVRERAARGIPREKVRVWEVSHLGGHKFAANAVLFPSSHLLGNLRPSHAPLIIDSLFAEPDSHYPFIPRELIPFWRGKNGLTKEEMKVFWVGATGFAPPPPSSSAEEEKEKEAKPVEIVFTTWEGEEVVTQALEGESVMDLGKRLELGAMEGVCGGVLECATCHCFLPPIPEPAPIPEVTDEEEDMLVNAMSPRASSRLGCQIKVTRELGEWVKKGGRVGLPRY